MRGKSPERTANAKDERRNTMKQRLAFHVCLLAAAAALGGVPEFHRGVNLTGWMQAADAHRIQFAQYTKKDFQDIRSLGCDVIRLPLNLHAMTNGAPGYTVDPLFFLFLDSAMDWAEALGLVLILDNHSFDPSIDTDPAIGDVLVPVWKQMAAHCKNRSDRICYEVLNEPHGISDAAWNAIQQRTVEAIRTVDTTHAIVVGASGWNGYGSLGAMPQYSDAKLIYTFHFYDPFLFTHQGAGWADPSLESLAGVPFPYDPARMPPCPPDLRGTWIENSLLYGYALDGTEKRVREALDIAASFHEKRNVPLFCGEFGVYMPHSDKKERAGWYKIVRSYLEEKGIPWTIWDYRDGFGLFEPGTAEMFEHDINTPLVEALGLDAPVQTPFAQGPDSAGFGLYSDFVMENIRESSWISEGLLDFYCDTDPVSGSACIHWSGSARYNAIVFSFRPYRDLSRLVQNGYALDFRVKGDSPASKFDVRFIDTKTTDAGDHPWRMTAVVDNKTAAWNGGWNHLSIPLEDFTEQGSWDDNAWFNPQGLFDWTDVDRFEIAAEHLDLAGMEFWFDDIRIAGPPAGIGTGGPAAIPSGFTLEPNSPNPFNPATRITYGLAVECDVRITVVDAAGRLVRVLDEGRRARGPHAVSWDGLDGARLRSPGGLYICVMNAPGFRQARKMVLLR
jgi:endoglucanase